jgi:hypothetical protein
MAQRQRDNGETTQVPFGFGTIAVVNGSMASAMAHNRAMFEKSIRAMQEEALRFINRQLEENANAIESCQECENLADLLALQHKWLTHSIVDFYDEGARMGETLHKLLSDKMEEAGEETVSELRRTKRRSAEQQEAA